MWVWETRDQLESDKFTRIEVWKSAVNVDIQSTVQDPIPTDWDSVYEKDIDVDNSSIWTFTGTVANLFNDYNTEITDVSWTDPKTLTIRFNRPVTALSVGIGSWTWDFSNVKILLKDLSWVVRQTIDDSSNNTKYTSNLYPFPPSSFIEMVIEFHTTDPVKLNGMLIQKLVDVIAQLRALKPDWTSTYIDATAWGNLKVSIEEIEKNAEIKYDILIDDTTTANITYIWEAEIWSATNVALWRIKRIDESSNFALWWADWDTNFDNKWTERASLTYSQ